jgi:methionyl-tRNA formyltransferase
MRLVFAGTPAPALPTMRTLETSRHEIVAVVTRADAPIGRKRILTPSAVAQGAAELRLRILKANRLDDDVTSAIRSLQPDLGVIVAYGGLVREPLLSLPRLGWINLHFSLLPSWRGAAPVQRAIMAGDRISGASVFQLVAALDAGAVFGTTERAIGADETAGDVLIALAREGATLTERIVDELDRGIARAVPQVGQVTIAPKLSIDDAHLEPAQPAVEVYNRFRAVTPEPGAFVFVHDTRLAIKRARQAPERQQLAGEIVGEQSRVFLGTATHAIELLEVQPAGKRPMPAADWWRGQSRQGRILAR